MDPKHLVPGAKYRDEDRQCHLYFVGKMPLRRDGVQMYAFQKHRSTTLQSIGEAAVINSVEPVAKQDSEMSFEQTTKRSKTMDQNIAAILRDDTTTIEVSMPNGVNLTYVTDLQVKVGDLVVLPTNSGQYAVRPVVGVHDELQVEPNSEIEYRWVVQVLDLSQYNINLEKNALIKKSMATTYRKTARSAFRQSALACASDEDRAKLESILGAAQSRLGVEQ